MTDKDIAYQLLGILQHYAPNKAAQELCAKLHRGGKDQKQLVRMHVMAICDGLLYGNWPWVIAAMLTEEKKND